jgi:hypothetical protein
MRPGQKLNRFRIDFSQPQFRSGKIRHDCDASICFTRGLTDAPNNFSVFRRLPVREIQSRDIQTGAN